MHRRLDHREASAIACWRETGRATRFRATRTVWRVLPDATRGASCGVSEDETGPGDRRMSGREVIPCGHRPISGEVPPAVCEETCCERGQTESCRRQLRMGTGSSWNLVWSRWTTGRRLRFRRLFGQTRTRRTDGSWDGNWQDENLWQWQTPGRDRLWRVFQVVQVVKDRLVGMNSTRNRGRGHRRALPWSRTWSAVRAGDEYGWISSA